MQSPRICSMYKALKIVVAKKVGVLEHTVIIITFKYAWLIRKDSKRKYKNWFHYPLQLLFHCLHFHCKNEGNPLQIPTHKLVFNIEIKTHSCHYFWVNDIIIYNMHILIINELHYYSFNLTGFV